MNLCLAAHTLFQSESIGVSAILAQVIVGDGPEREAFYIGSGIAVLVSLGIVSWVVIHWRLKNRSKVAHSKPFVSSDSLERFEQRKRKATKWQRARIYAGIFTLFLSSVTTVIPLYGMLVAAFALALNLKVGSWPLRYSVIGFCISSLITCIFISVKMVQW